MAGSPPSSPGSKTDNHQNLVSTLSRNERLTFLEREDKEVSLRVQADLLSVSRANVYYQPTPPSLEELSIKRRIEALLG